MPEAKKHYCVEVYRCQTGKVFVDAYSLEEAANLAGDLMENDPRILWLPIDSNPTTTCTPGDIIEESIDNHKEFDSMETYQKLGFVVREKNSQAKCSTD